MLPFDILSRIDLLINLGPGDEALRSAMKIASQAAQAEYDPGEDENRPMPDAPSTEGRRERRVKLVVALIKDLIPLVDFSQVEDDLEETTLALGVVMREYTSRLGAHDEDSHDGEGLIRRMANTVRKLVGALARAEGRGVAEKRDLDRAWDLVSPKMEVVRWIAGETDKVRTLPTRQQQVEMVLRGSMERWQRVVAALAGQRVQIGQVVAAAGCTEKTARRELAKRGVEPDGVWFHIPLAAPDRPPSLWDELMTPPADNGIDDLPAPPVQEEEPWQDCLPRPPAECQAAVAALSQMGAGSQQSTVEGLFDLALRENAGRYEDVASRAVCRPLVEAMMAVELGAAEVEQAPPPEGPMQALAGWLSAPEWGLRGLRALGLYAAAGLVDRLKCLEGMRARAGALPAEVEAGLCALAERERITDERMRQEAEDAARRFLEERARRLAAEADTPLWRWSRRGAHG